MLAWIRDPYQHEETRHTAFRTFDQLCLGHVYALKILDFVKMDKGVQLQPCPILLLS